MADTSPGQATQLLIDWSGGDTAALAKLTPLIYDELHRLANRFLRHERGGHTLQATALVNEAYLRLIDQRSPHWQNRAHFFAIAARLMRRILIDYARARQYAKRGGGAPHVALDEAMVLSDERAADLVALDEALTSLASIDPQQSRVVELRFFGGLTIEETAEVLKLSHDMVKREWSTAKAWLSREMSGGRPHDT
jgi:RNA polymerase sigma factor (TIGR02999 family)